MLLPQHLSGIRIFHQKPVCDRSHAVAPARVTVASNIDISGCIDRQRNRRNVKRSGPAFCTAWGEACDQSTQIRAAKYEEVVFLVKLHGLRRTLKLSWLQLVSKHPLARRWGDPSGTHQILSLRSLAFIFASARRRARALSSSALHCSPDMIIGRKVATNIAKKMATITAAPMFSLLQTVYTAPTRSRLGARRTRFETRAIPLGSSSALLVEVRPPE